MTAYISEAIIADIRDDPSLIVDYYNQYRSQFIADLGLPAMDEATLQAAWCSVVAYNFAPYGNGPGNDFADLLDWPALECTGYVTLTWHLINEFGISIDDQAAVGWYDGAVGNHSQMLVSVNGSHLLLDPTVGLVVYGVTLEGLTSGTPYSEYASFYHRNDISDFNETVIDAVSQGSYQVQDAIYYVPGLDNWLNNYFDYVGLTIEHGGDSQTIVGYIDDDVIDAGPGNDFLSGGRGDDILNGDAGFDTVLYSDNRSDYLVEFLSPGHYRVTQAVSGVDLINDVEQFHFADQSIPAIVSQVIATDAADLYSWTTETTNLAYNGDPISVIYQLDNGGGHLYEYDALDQFVWDRIQTARDSSSSVTRILYEEDSGERVGYLYDTSNAGTWSSITTYYEANWTVSHHLYGQDDGTGVLYEYDFANAGAWQQIATYFNNAEQVSKRLYDQDNGTQVLYEYDLSTNAWDRITSYLDTDGAVVSRLYDQDDGTHVKYLYDVDDAFSWFSQERHYRSDMTVLKDVVHNDDGTHTVLDFDTDGTMLVSNLNYDSHWTLIT